MSASIRSYYGPARSDAETKAALGIAEGDYGSREKKAVEHLRILRRQHPSVTRRDVIVAVHQGKVIGVTRILDRSLMFKGRRLRAGGVTEVAIHPDHRGHGHGARLVEATLRRSGERGDVLSILFARRAVDGFYPPFGYLGIGVHPLTEIDMDRIRSAAGGIPTIRIRESPAGLGRAARAYTRTYRDSPLAFARTPSWWKSLAHVWPIKVPRGRWVELGSNGYCVVRQDGTLIEWAAQDLSPPSIHEGLIGVQHALSLPSLKIRLPANHSVMRAIAGLNHTTSVRFAWDGGHMVRIVDPIAWAKVLASGAPTRPQQSTRLGAIPLMPHARALRLLRHACGLDGGKERAQIAPLPTWSSLDEI